MGFPPCYVPIIRIQVATELFIENGICITYYTLYICITCLTCLPKLFVCISNVGILTGAQQTLVKLMDK